MAKEKRCLKFTGYIYLPEKTSDFNNLRYLASRTPGRLIIFDEHNNRPTEKAFAFDNLGEAIDKIEKERRKRVYKIVKHKK